MNKPSTVTYLLVSTVVLAFFSAVAAYLAPQIPLLWQITGGLAVVTAIAGVWLSKTALGKTLGKKTTLYGLNSLLMVVLFLAIAVVLNLITSKYDVKRDFTKNKLHTLSEQSIKVVKGLQQDVSLKAFISPMQRPEFEKIFEKYTYFSKKLTPEYIDVDQDPLLVQKYDIKRAGTIIVETAARHTKIDNLQGPDDPKLEQKITNALIQVAKGDKKKIYFTSGHGELLPSETGPKGFSQAKESLEGSRYDVKDLLLAQSEAVPADAEILIIAGPKSDFLEHELKALDTFIAKGGKALFLMEPDSTATLKPLLMKFGADWHVKQAIVETNPLQRLAGGNPLTPIVTNYDGTHEITQEIKQLSIFAVATPIGKATPAPEGATVNTLFSSSDRSFEVPLQGDKVKLDPNHDTKGPFSMAVAVSGKIAGAPAEPKKEGADAEADKKEERDYRVVVVGDVDFASNSFRTKGVNSDLFENMVSWLSHDADLIAIRPKASDTSTFDITESRFRIINLASVVIAPLLMFMSGFAVWFTRRRK